MHLSEFGGIPNDPKDDTQALNAALQAVSELAPAQIILKLDAGRYLFSSADVPPHRGHVILDGLSNLTLSGVGPETELIMTDTKASGIVLRRCENVRIEQLSVDYDPLPHTQGTIIAADPDKRSFDVEIDPGFPSPLDEHIVTETWRKTRAYLFKPNSTELNTLFFDQYPAWASKGVEARMTHLGGHTFRYHSRNPVQDKFVGYRVAIVGRSNNDAFIFEESTNCSAVSVDLYSAPAAAFKVRHSKEGTTIDHCRVIPKPGTTRLLASNADALHAKFNRGGIHLHNSRFEASGDDGVNIGGAYQAVYEQADPHTLIIQAHNTYKIGDTVTLTDTVYGSVIATSTVKAVGNEKWKGKIAVRITLNEPVETTSTVDDGTPYKQANQLTSIATSGQNSTLIGNDFINIRGRGIMMHGDNSVIEGNTFKGFRGPGIVIGPDFWWGESSSGSHLKILNNHFDDIYWNNIIAHGGKKLSHDYPAASSDILVEGNTFTKYGRPNPIPGRGVVGPILSFSNASDVVIRNNVFGKPHPESKGGPLVVLEKARDIEISKNTFETDKENWLETDEDVDLQSIRID